jgi:hypothetical protein
MFKTIAFLCAAALAGPVLAQDDPAPPPDAAALISEAGTAYGAGEYGRSRRALEKAVEAVAGKHAEAIRATLPAAFEGWTMADGNDQPVSLTAIGGGLSIDRTYMNSDGTEVRIDILADSDLVAQMAKMYADDNMLQMMGMKIETLGGEKAFIDPNNGDVTFLFDERTNIKVSGSASAENRKAYAENINFAAFRAIK